MKSRGRSGWLILVIMNIALCCVLFLGACSFSNKQTSRLQEREKDDEETKDSMLYIEPMGNDINDGVEVEEEDKDSPNVFKRYERKRVFTKMEAIIGLTLPMNYEGWMAQCLAEFLWMEAAKDEQSLARPQLTSYASLMDYYLTLQVGTEGPDIDENRMHQTYVDTDSLNVVPVWQSDDNSYTTYRIKTFFYHGGAHPLYKDFYLTFDNRKHRMLSSNDIFKAGSMQDVIRRLKMKAGGRSVFCYEEIEDQEDAMEPISPRWEHYQTHYIPRPALTAQGVVFSYQRYEIDAFAAGEFHFILPYEEVMNLLNPDIVNTLKL